MQKVSSSIHHKASEEAPILEENRVFGGQGMLCSQRLFQRDQDISSASWGVCKPCELLEMDKDTHQSLVIWHIDEVFVNAMNTVWYMWCVVDQDSRCLAIYLSLHRDMQSAVSALLMAKEFAEQIPDIVVSDDYDAYPGGIRKAFGWRWKGLHVQAHFEPVIVRHKGFVLSLSNNRIEGFNSWLRERVTILHGFKNDFYMMKYLEGFQKVWNSTKFLGFH